MSVHRGEYAHCTTEYSNYCHCLITVFTRRIPRGCPHRSSGNPLLPHPTPSSSSHQSSICFTPIEISVNALHLFGSGSNDSLRAIENHPEEIGLAVLTVSCCFRRSFTFYPWPSQLGSSIFLSFSPQDTGSETRNLYLLWQPWLKTKLTKCLVGVWLLY